MATQGNIVAYGLGTPLLVTMGMGGFDTPSQTTNCILELGDAEIFVGIQKVGGNWYLLYRDASHDLSILLPMSAAQIAGTSYAFIRLRRSGSNLYVYLDKTLVATVALSAVETCEADAVIMRGVDHTLYDLRVNNEAISKAAGDYCYDDITQNYGKSMLPSAA